MKNQVLIILLCTVFACQNTGKKEAAPATENQGTAKFGFQEEFHNFGLLQAGEVVAYSFQFTNTGDGSLVIEKVEADCGCIKVNFPKEAIAPGKTSWVEVVLNTAGETGQVYQELEVFANTDAGKIKLAVAATVQNEMINLYSNNLIKLRR
jgi:hypothetical protein